MYRGTEEGGSVRGTNQKTNMASHASSAEERTQRVLGGAGNSKQEPIVKTVQNIFPVRVVIANVNRYPSPSMQSNMVTSAATRNTSLLTGDHSYTGMCSRKKKQEEY